MMLDAFAMFLTLLNLTVYAWPFVKDLLALAMLWRIGTWMKKGVKRGI